MGATTIVLALKNEDKLLKTQQQINKINTFKYKEKMLMLDRNVPRLIYKKKIILSYQQT